MDLPLANVVLEIENKNYPIGSNFFDISDKSDSISFISDKKAKEISDKNQGKYRYVSDGRYLSSERNFQYLWDELGLTREEIDEPPVGTLGTLGKSVKSPKSGKVFVVFNPDNTEYEPIPVNIEALKVAGLNYNDSIFWTSSRQLIRVGRGIKSILTSSGVKVTDKEIETFVNKYKATIDSINDVFVNFEIIKGDDIAYWYSKDQYFLDENGSLGASCMCEVDDEFFDIYCNNPERVSLVIYKAPEDPFKIKGRALLWLLNSGKQFMDRIYTHHDSDIELFRQYAKLNGYWCKYHNSSTSEGDAYIPTNQRTEVLDLIVNLKPCDHDRYPYLDTLKYYNKETGVISNVREPGMILLEDTDGGYTTCGSCDSTGYVECDDCDGSGEEECGDCDGDGYVNCSSCDDGNVECSECNGSGEVDDEDCDICNGSGSITCEECSGKGTETCTSCEGSGNDDCSTCNGTGNEDCSSCS